MKTRLYIPNSHYDGSNIWLVKAPDLNRGRCIKIGNSLDKIKSLIKRFHDGIIKDFKSEEDAVVEEEKESNK